MMNSMENQRSPVMGVSFAYYCQGKSVEEELWYAKLELDQTKVAVQEELKKKDDEVFHLKEVLSRALKERDEAREYQSLLLDKLLILQQQQQQQQVGPTPILSGISSVEQDDPARPVVNGGDNGFSSSDCDDSIVSSSPAAIEATDKGLPEKGKLLQAVMKAGPLLQTLLLAGPLPQWRHPPPPLESFQIPPVSIPSSPFLHRQETFDVNDTNNGDGNNKLNRKRVLLLSSQDEPSENKYQRILLN